jgi:hypothetical protein
MQRYTHLYAGQQRETIENLPDFVLQQDIAAMTGTYDCVGKNRAENNCPKTANQREKFRTNPNISCDAKTLGNTGLLAINNDKTALSYEKCPPALLGQKIGATVTRLNRYLMHFSTSSRIIAPNFR